MTERIPLKSMKMELKSVLLVEWVDRLPGTTPRSTSAVGPTTPQRHLTVCSLRSRFSVFALAEEDINTLMDEGLSIFRQLLSLLINLPRHGQTSNLNNRCGKLGAVRVSFCKLSAPVSQLLILTNQDRLAYSKPRR